jgi:hypothetical protein
MQATQAVFDNRFTMSYGNTNHASLSRTQIAFGSSHLAGNAFIAPRNYGYAQSGSVASRFEREVRHTPNGSIIKTSVTTLRPADPFGRMGPANCFSGRDLGRSNGHDNDRCHVPPPASRCPQPQPPRNCNGGSDWSNTQVKDNKASVDLGKYTLDFNKSDSSMTMRNKSTGDTTKVWGDPHIDLHDGTANKTSGMFNGPMTFNLPDSTKVTVSTKSGGNASVSYADQVTITRGNQAYQVSGLSEKNSNPLTVQRSRDGRALDAQTPDGYSLVANRNGSGWIDPKTGKEPTKADFAKV